MKKVKVLEVDQWTSTGNVAGTKMEEWESPGRINQVSGGDSEAARIIFGGSAVVKEVSEDASPRTGDVWFRENEKGVLERWKANYDSSG